MQQKNDQKDMRQPNSFQEQGNYAHPKDEKDTRQPNSFQEQPPNTEKNRTQKSKENEGFSMNDTISRQEDSFNK